MSPAATPGTRQGGRRRRLDDLLVERGLAADRARAGALVLAGKVRVGPAERARRDRKPGELVDTEIEVAIEGPPRYVGRGGHKLAAALDAFGIHPAGRTCLDVGASTGGFTDVLLQRGAARVYALDVGRGQLAESLRADPRVVALERTNARTLTSATLPDRVDLAVIDVSFISLDRILAPVAATFGPDGGDIVALVKPQFEAPRGRAPRGVVGDPDVRRDVVERIASHAMAVGLVPRDAIASPLAGADGNREILLWLDVPAATAAGEVQPVAALPVALVAAIERATEQATEQAAPR